jgi:hypothetical protein
MYMPKLLSTLFYILFSVSLYAQDSESEAAFVRNARNYAVKSYYQFTGLQARLYNGTEHTGYLNSIIGNAYYLTDSLSLGQVFYDGLAFSPVQMRYDIFKDELVIKHFSGLQITLLSEKLRDFSFRNRHFVRYVYDSLARIGVPTGIYEHMFESSKFTVLARRIKTLEEKVTDEVIREFFEDDHYYLIKEGKQYYFKSRKSFLKAFGPKSGQVRRHLRKLKINYRKQRDTAIIEAAKFYEQLN